MTDTAPTTNPRNHPPDDAADKNSATPEADSSDAPRPQEGQNGGAPDNKSDGRGDWLETVAAWISGLLILAVAAVLVWEALRPQAPPSFDVQSGEIREAGGKYYVTFSLHNRGDEAAQQVEIQAELLRDGQKADEAKATLEWSPGRSRRQGTVVFDQDPRQGTLHFRVTGYAEP